MVMPNFVQPDYTAQDATTYKTNLDHAIKIAARQLDAFAPHAQASPNMTVALDAGPVYDGSTLTAVAAQNTGAISAPASHPRKDIVYIDRLTGAAGIATGAENASPVDPALSVGKVPVARVTLATSTAAITASLIDDLRVLNVMGLGDLAFQSSAAISGVAATFTGAVLAGSLALTAALTPANGWALPSANQPALYQNSVEILRADGGGRILKGHTANLDGSEVQIVSGTNQYLLSVRNYAASGAAAIITLAHSRSATIGGHAVLQNGDGIGGFQFNGDDGDQDVAAAAILALVNGTPSDNGMPTRLACYTTATGASSYTERFGADAKGNFIVGAYSGDGSLSTSATDGFAYFPNCAGTPTGTPSTLTGRSPTVIDATNHKFYFYSGSWLAALTANQTITLSGDVTGSGSTAITTTIAANVVTYAKFQQVAAVSLVGNATGSLANATGITLGATLAFSGSALQTAALTGDVTAGANSYVTTVAKIAGTTVSGTTGTGNVAFSASPTFTGTIGCASLTATGTVSAITRALVGTSTNQVSTPLQVASTTMGIGLSVLGYAASASSLNIAMYKSRGASIGAAGAVTADDPIGQLSFLGDGGSGFLLGGCITGFVDGAVTTTGMPTRLNSQTSAAGSSTPTGRWQADCKGSIAVGPGRTTDGTLSTSATDGGFYIPVCAGLPTGTPTVWTGRDAMVIDSAAGALMIYNSAWIDMRGVPINSYSAAHTTTMAERNTCLLHPTADNNARTFTIDSNANVPYPLGTVLLVMNEINTVTIAITSDTLKWVGSGSTGSRTLAAGGRALAHKTAATMWWIDGTGLT